VSPGDLLGDYELKKNFYCLISKYEENALMLTKCYFNKIKYRSVYDSTIENIIKKYK
jgi:hypothetical protein